MRTMLPIEEPWLLELGTQIIQRAREPWSELLKPMTLLEHKEMWEACDNTVTKPAGSSLTTCHRERG